MCAGCIRILCTESWLVFLTGVTSVGSITNCKHKGIHPLGWTVRAVLSVTRDERDFGLNECFSVWVQTIWELRHCVVQHSGFCTISCDIQVPGLCHEETRKAKEENKWLWYRVIAFTVIFKVLRGTLEKLQDSGLGNCWQRSRSGAGDQLSFCMWEPEVPLMPREETYGELRYKVWILFGEEQISLDSWGFGDGWDV